MPSVNDRPVVTVLMAVRNGAAFLHEAIESILGQTLNDFEFVIVNDASTDNTRTIVQSYSDHRIRLIENASPMGLAASLNRGLEVAKGTYVARMDCDDISFKHRLERQVQFLEANHDICMCGSWAELIDEANRPQGLRRKPSGDEIRAGYWLTSPIIHSSAIIRRAQLSDLRYDETLSCAQDYDLWFRLARRCKVDNIPEPLLSYRVHAKSVSNQHRVQQLKDTYEIFVRNTRITGISYDDFLTLIHASYDRSPVTRFLLSRRFSRLTGVPYRWRLADDLSYFRGWVANARRRH
jgi:glycosyltransferase involved in cell wall biosynthesis